MPNGRVPFASTTVVERLLVQLPHPRLTSIHQLPCLEAFRDASALFALVSELLFLLKRLRGRTRTPRRSGSTRGVITPSRELAVQVLAWARLVSLRSLELLHPSLDAFDWACSSVDTAQVDAVYFPSLLRVVAVVLLLWRERRVWSFAC